MPRQSFWGLIGWWTRQTALASLLALGLPNSAAGQKTPVQKIKVIVDQDARGPGTSDQQAILVFLQSEKFEVLGITTVSGDQWVREETQHTLRMLEIAGRTEVPVIQGAEFPLLNSKEESERWEALYGKLEYKGCWTERFAAKRSTIFEEPYHPPEVVPPLPARLCTRLTVSCGCRSIPASASSGPCRVVGSRCTRGKRPAEIGSGSRPHLPAPSLPAPWAARQ
jgi:hypothetical protein